MKVGLLTALFALLALPAASADKPHDVLTFQQRIEIEHLKAAHEARLRFAREREKIAKTLPVHGLYDDYRAVLNVHAGSEVERKAALEAARQAGVRVVMFAAGAERDSPEWNGTGDGILYFGGAEDGGGELRFAAYDSDPKLLRGGEWRFLPPGATGVKAASNIAGMEVFRQREFDSARAEFLKAAAKTPDRWLMTAENFKAFPDEFFGASCGCSAGIIEEWDRKIRERSCAGIACSDAMQHAAIDGTIFDSYALNFRNCCTHILARELTGTEIRQALHDGHTYISFDWLCDPTGFVFGGMNNFGIFPMGDPVPYLMGSTQLVAYTPATARLKLFHNGKVIQEIVGTNLTFTAKEAGSYRFEAWLNVDGEDRPWIFANPVYLQGPSLDTLSTLRFPNYDLFKNVEVKENITYLEGKPEDEAKHKLDIYLPKSDGAKKPVFVFIHGGSWRMGDRSMYLAVGGRFASSGIITVLPSYRLAPKNPHPAQIEDVAAAFAWTVKHIGEYGGDVERIYIGGHSAGGHLAALLTLNERYLKSYGLSVKNIHGTIAASGVYNLVIIGESQSSVFGRDQQIRREGSPVFHVKDSPQTIPRFLVSYCQWDFPTLPAQAREFHTALREAGANAELLYVPHESHISEMLSLTQDNDMLAKAMLEFMKK